jgi:hypothetical protein
VPPVCTVTVPPLPPLAPLVWPVLLLEPTSMEATSLE